MSFVYAFKYEAEFDHDICKYTDIYSDTKISLEGTSKYNWGEKTIKAIEKYGMVKSIIIAPKCCISFAGNNIAHAHKLLSILYNQQFTKEYLLDLALGIHCAAPDDDIEFIICLADEDNETELICIKDKKIQRDCSIAWIGSREAFRRVQEFRFKDPGNPKNCFGAFNYAINHCKDDSVGGFSINVQFDSISKRFIYPFRLETYVEREQKLVSGSQVKITGSAEEGACTIYYHSSNEDVALEIEQANLTLLYTQKYRLDDRDILNPGTKYFLLPIAIRTDSGEVI